MQPKAFFFIFLPDLICNFASVGKVMRELVEKALAEVLFQNEYVKIGINSELSLITVKWRRQIFLEERKAGYHTVFEFVKKQAAQNLLVDNSNLFLFSIDEKRWVAETFNAWVNQTSIRKFALVTSDEYRNLLDLSEYINTAKQHYQFLNKVSHEFFTDYETAVLWITDQF